MHVREKNLLTKLRGQGWRVGSVVKSVDCSSKGPEFNSQHLHDGPQTSEIHLMPSFGVPEDSYSVLIYIKNKP